MEILKNLDLWQRIAAFPLDDPNSAHPFSKKLMTEQKWSETSTLRALAEYKKFIYLAIVEPNGASPSEDVDEVWHLHITYTEGYAQFCQATAGRFLHHHPSKGGVSEFLRHKTWASDTIQNYYKHFGYAPPSDIWDVPFGFQFENDRPIEIAEIEVYEPPVEFLIGGGFILGLLCLAINPFISGSHFLIFYILTAIIGLGTASFFESEKLAKAMTAVKNALPKNLNHLQVAAFLYDTPHAIKILLVDLMDNQVLKNPMTILVRHFELHRLNGNESLYKNPLYTTQMCVERTTIEPNFLKTVSQSVTKILDTQLDTLRKRTNTTSYLKWAARLLVFIGAIRFVQGSIAHRPIGFLVMTLALIGVFYWVAKMVILDDFKTRIHAWVRLQYRQILPNISSAERFAFEGTPALETAFIPMLLFWDAMNTPESDSDNRKSSGCSSGDGGSGGCSGGGCSGGGCGGGCGGCGGCGG